MKWTIAGALAGATLALGGCSTVEHWIDPGKPVYVAELHRVANCATEGAGSHVHFLTDAERVRDWEAARGVDLTGGAELPRGPFAVLELGERKLQGYGLVVSRNATVHRGGRLILRSTFIYTVQVGPEARHGFASPCVLLQLPPRHYSSIELYDQDGIMRAYTPIPSGSPG